MVTTQTATLIVGGPAAVLALGALVRWAWRTARHLDRLVSAVSGDPEASPPVPPLRQWQAAVDEQLRELKVQFSPNGGTSMRDGIDDLNANVRALAQAQGVPLPRPPRP